MRWLKVGVLAVLMMSLSRTAHAQFEVHDPAIFIQNTIMHALEGDMLGTAKLIDDQIRRAGRRFWLFVNPQKYKLVDVPLWRTRHVAPLVRPAEAFFEAINGGDWMWDGRLVDEAVVPRYLLEGVPMTRDLFEQVANLEADDAALKNAVQQVGILRGNRKEPLRVMTALEADTLDDSGSLAKVSDVLAVGELASLWQKMERGEMLTVLGELLLMDTKRDHDAVATDIRMRMNTQSLDLGAGASNALSRWRLP